MKSGAPSADEIIEAARIANKPVAGKPMTCKKAHGIRPGPRESEYVESILDILDKEMALAATDPGENKSSNEMDLLVADLLEFLEIED